MTDQVYYEVYKKFYSKGDYAHHFVMTALDGTGIFSGKDNAARIQGVKKGSAYLNVWMYVIREMEDAVDDCRAGCINCNDDPVHAWDEAVAFYTGTKHGTEAGTTTSGKLLYALANKRCQNFKTCSGTGGAAAGTGNSKVNTELFTLFTQGKVKLQEGKCSEVPAIKDSIIKKMAVPMIQGSLRYAYKVAKLSGASKEKAEGAVFAAAVLPLVHSCSAAAATTISDNMKIDSTTPMTAGFAAVKSAFESTYSCLGIKCHDVGGLILTGSEYHTGAGPCEDPTPGAPTSSASGARVVAITVIFSSLALARHWGGKQA